MNWTGGRLQRHSAHSGDLARVQKQRFAKPKLKRSNGAQISPIFQGETHLQRSDEPAHQPSASHELPSSRNAAPVVDKSSQALSHLDRIKCQLLETNDWAAVGATRPVKMSFTSTQELDNFGKRRRLTEADHHRLVSSGGRVGPLDSLVSRERARKRAPSEFGTIGNVDIQIRGPEYLETGQSKNNESSQAMLLESDCMDQDTLDAYRPSGRGRTDSSLLLSSGERPLGSRVSSAGSPVHRFASQNDKGNFIDRSSSPSEQPLRLSRNPDSSQPIPQTRRRFTIDDQVVAEQETSNPTPSSINMTGYHEDDTSSYTSDLPDVCCSGRELVTAAGTQSTPSNQCSGWLPKPRHQIQRFVGEGPRPTISEVNRGQSTIKPPGMHALGQYTPVKLFGQSVTLDGETVSTCQGRLPNAHQRLHHGELPTRYMTPSPQPIAQVSENINPEYFSNPREPRNQRFTDTNRGNRPIIYGQQLPSTSLDPTSRQIYTNFVPRYAFSSKRV